MRMPPLAEGQSSYRWLFAAVLLSIALAQVVAMAFLAQSQVQKAREREAMERANPSFAGRAAPPASAQRPAAGDDTIQVGYVFSR